MRNSISLTTTFLILFSLRVLGQSSSISGQIIDEKEQAVPFATVILFDNSDSSMVKTAISNEEGSFLFASIKAGSYKVQSSFVGFETNSSEAFEINGKSDKELPSLRLKENAQQLEAVTVQAKRPIIEVQPDKTVFNVEGSINAQGNTALELLRKSPGVVVDNNENLVLQGKSGVQVYIDGKRSPLSSDDLAIYLKNLQSDQIDAIEVITNPSAKYDAEGNAGIINIRLIKDQSLGTNGSVNVGYRYGWNAKYNGSINLNHRNKFLNVYGSYSGFTGDKGNEFWITREQSGIRYRQQNDMLDRTTNHRFKIGTDFFINENSTIGFLVNGNRNDREEFGDSYTKIEEISDSVVDSLLVASNDQDGKRDNTNINLNYAWRNKSGQSFSIDLDYGNFENEMSSYQPNQYLLPDGETVLNTNTFRNVTPTTIDIYTAKADYETPFLIGQLGVGAKMTNVETDNTFDNFDLLDGVWVKNDERSNRFEYTERVAAAYVSYQKKLNDQWNLMTGFRVEHTFSEGDLTSAMETENDNVKRNYTDYFPSAGLTYKHNKEHSFSANYSRRIDRPNYENLNPFEFKLDELSFRKGNPFLQPQYSNSYSVTHTYKGTLSTSLNYTVIQDVSTRITEALDEQSAILTFVNLATQTNLALTVSYPFAVTKWWNVYATVTGYRLHNEANIEGDIIDLETKAFNFYAQNTFSLPHGIRLEISGWYNSPAIWAGNWTTEELFDVSAGVSKQFFNKRGNLKISVSDIFYENGWAGQSEFGELRIRGGGNWESRQLKVNFRYAFGSNKVKGARKRKTGMEEESKRTSS